MSLDPTPYSQTDFTENESIHLFTSALNRKLVRTDIKSRDKYPNFDGYMEIVDETNTPRGKLELQIKTLSSNATTYYCDPRLIAYSETTTLPVILILVDQSTKSVYWKHLLRANGRITKKNKSYRFLIDPTDEITDKNSYVIQWLAIANDYQKKINQQQINSTVDLSQEFSLPPKNLKHEQIKFFQEFIDELNSGIDTVFPFVKLHQFRGVWKIGVAVGDSPNQQTFGLFSIPIGSSDLLVKEINPACTIDPFQGNVFQYYSTLEENKSPKQLAFEFYKDYAIRTVEAKVFPYENIEIANECAYALLDKYHFMFDLPEKDAYSLPEVKRNLMTYFPLWIAVALEKLSYPKHLPYIDISLLGIYKHEAVTSKVKKILNGEEQFHYSQSMLFHSKESDIGLFHQALEFLENNEVTSIVRKLPRGNSSLIGNVAPYASATYTRETLIQMTTQFFHQVYYIYDDFVDKNHFPAEFKFNLGKNRALIVVPKFAENPYQLNAMFVEQYFLEVINFSTASEAIMVLNDLSSVSGGYSADWFQSGFTHQGNQYRLTRVRRSVFDIILNDTPYLTYIYKLIEEKLQNYEYQR